MPYRFTVTEKWEKAWFTGLSPWSKLVFIYLCENCDVAGVYELNETNITAQTGLTLAQITKALDGLTPEFRGERRVVRCGPYLWVVKFVLHQRNLPLNPDNNAHKSIIRSLEKHSSVFGCDLRKALEDNTLISPSIAPAKPLARGIGNGKGNGKGLGGAGGKGVTEAKAVFEKARVLYPGTKRGLDVEFAYFQKKHKNWREVVGKLEPAIRRQIDYRASLLAAKEFVPAWKHFQAWISNSWWEASDSLPNPLEGVKCSCGRGPADGQSIHQGTGKKYYWCRECQPKRWEAQQ